MARPREHKSVSIKVDTDGTLGYETNSFFRVLWRYIYSPILNYLPSSTSKLIKKSNIAAAHVIDNKTNHEALETLYKCGHSHARSSLIQRCFRRLWFGVDNSRAVRNRLKMVEKEIKIAILELLSRKSDIHLLSIASGSSRSVVLAISQLENLGQPIYLSFLDKNPNAIDYSKNLVKMAKLKSKTTWFLDTANNFPVYFIGIANPNIIEMVGLLDYFTDEQVKKIFKTIFDNLQEGGYLITANISDNHERPFISKVVGWHMIYRSAEELIDLAHEVGFDVSKMHAYYEPLNIHCVLVARK